MHLRLLIIFSIIINLLAQDLNYSNVDEQSYQFFISKKTKELKELGYQALEQKIDFYLLRLRLGIIYYEEKNYDLALEHFLVALESNPADDLLQEYVYFTYLFSNRFTEADSYGSSLSMVMKNKVNFKIYAKDQLSLEVGSLSNDQNKNKEQNVKGNLGIFGETVYQLKMTYYSLILNKIMDSKLNILLGMSIFNTISLGVSQRIDSEKSEEFNLQQTQLNLAGVYKLEDNLTLGLGLGLYKQNYSYLTSYIDTVLDKSIFYSNNLPSNSYSINASLNKRLNYITINLNLGYSNFRNRVQTQSELSLAYYPFGNSDLYLISKFSMINDDKEYNKIYGQAIGFNIVQSLWLEANYASGDHMNYINYLGFLTYNTSDPVAKNIGLDLSYFWEDINLNAAYIYQERKGVIYNMSGYNLFELNTYRYNAQLIKVALKWEF